MYEQKNRDYKSPGPSCLLAVFCKTLDLIDRRVFVFAIWETYGQVFIRKILSDSTVRVDENFSGLPRRPEIQGLVDF